MTKMGKVKELEKLASAFLRANGEKELAIDYDAKLKREKKTKPPYGRGSLKGWGS